MCTWRLIHKNNLLFRNIIFGFKKLHCKGILELLTEQFKMLSANKIRKHIKIKLNVSMENHVFHLNYVGAR